MVCGYTTLYSTRIGCDNETPKMITCIDLSVSMTCACGLEARRISRGLAPTRRLLTFRYLYDSSRIRGRLTLVYSRQFPPLGSGHALRSSLGLIKPPLNLHFYSPAIPSQQSVLFRLENLDLRIYLCKYKYIQDIQGTTGHDLVSGAFHQPPHYLIFSQVWTMELSLDVDTQPLVLCMAALGYRSAALSKAFDVSGEASVVACSGSTKRCLIPQVLIWTVGLHCIHYLEYPRPEIHSPS
jgi:hypothetical protein